MSDDDRRLRWPPPRRWLEYFLAIVAGNALYFLVVMPRAPRSLVHAPFRLDAGLLLDLLLCVGVYLLARWAGSSWARD